MNKDTYKRKNSTKEIKDKVLILCCGETEKSYFECYKKHSRSKLKNLHIEVLQSKRNNSMYLVDNAMKSKSNSEYKEVWVVFDKDIDDFFDKAIEKARTKKIK